LNPSRIVAAAEIPEELDRGLKANLHWYNGHGFFL
jgi:hypothetical protein